ncbi:RsfA family transcriptional regulator [Bacillota bacterium Lsc_1132]
MSPTRQDAWSQDEDLLLAEVVLRHIREGGTQLQAFEEVGRHLSRTAAACGFRWNSYVRKQYNSGIELAKKQRKELKKQSVNSPEAVQRPLSVSASDIPKQDRADESGQLTFDAIIHFLQDLYQRAEASTAVLSDKEQSQEKIKELEKKIYDLAVENERLENELKTLESDYRSLIEIMERARKMVVLQEDRQQKGKLETVE